MCAPGVGQGRSWDEERGGKGGAGRGPEMRRRRGEVMGKLARAPKDNED